MAGSNRFLLDTHVFLWWMAKSSKLSKELLQLLSDPQKSIYLSVASVWEMIIKREKKKLKIPQDIVGGIKTSGFHLLPIEISHVLRIEKLPTYHQDPFDRMLIAQSITEKATLITSDEKIVKYKIDVLKVR